MKKIILFLLPATYLLVSCEPKESKPAISKAGYENHVQQLASDQFQGRLPFTEGEKTTLTYLEAEYKALGLEPGNVDSYLQEVPMVEITTTADPEMKITGKNNLTLIGREDYVIWTERAEEKIEFKKDEIVFAGFGVVAPEYNWNDYKGLNVKDKIVLVLVNDPGYGGQDTTFFKASTMTYYGRWTYKFEEAARQGAKACFVIHNQAPAGYAWNVPQNGWNQPHLFLDEREKEIYHSAAVGWISRSATQKLFAAAGLNFSEQQSAAEKPGFKGISLRLQASTELNVKTKFDKSYNVIGKITGTTNPDETVLYTAHWDHLGIGRKDDKGDSIYNGAVDNASGVAGMLEIAHAFVSEKEKPARTVVFLAVTAEEQGLKGSEYYTRNPIYPVDKTLANINIDGLNSYGRMKDIIVIGLGQSELEDYLNDEALKVGRYLSPDPNPSAGYYFRSDHFNFAKVGIPSLFTAIGIDHVEKGKKYGQQLEDDFITDHYHQPSDEFIATKWNSDGAIDDLHLLFNLGKRIVYGTEVPKWKKGSEFKSLRE